VVAPLKKLEEVVVDEDAVVVVVDEEVAVVVIAIATATTIIMVIEAMTRMTIVIECKWTPMDLLLLWHHQQQQQQHHQQQQYQVLRILQLKLAIATNFPKQNLWISHRSVRYPSGP